MTLITSRASCDAKKTWQELLWQKDTWQDCRRQEFLVQRHNLTSSAYPVPEFHHHHDVNDNYYNCDDDEDEYTMKYDDIAPFRRAGYRVF